jgi:hypothetical protein
MILGQFEVDHKRTVGSPWFARERKLVETHFAAHPTFISYVVRLLTRASLLYFSESEFGSGCGELQRDDIAVVRKAKHAGSSR